MQRVLLLLAGYAISMALLEAAVVVYMRRLYYPGNPLELFPLRFLQDYDPRLELSREAATIAMIVTVALLADRGSWTRRFASFVFVFGLWDLFYYVWLKVLMDWPRQWLEWDVLFLIPCIWLGPWICPAAIAMLFVAWGGWTLSSHKPIRLTPALSAIFVLGASLGLASFMEPAISNGVETLHTFQPGRFRWAWYLAGYGLMAGSLARSIFRPRPDGDDFESRGLIDGLKN